MKGEVLDICSEPTSVGMVLLWRSFSVQRWFLDQGRLALDGLILVSGLLCWQKIL
jgi:hypothetical protein